jgi:tRNA threonylcarbamoyladenosine biosynthesis protein TsaB
MGLILSIETATKVCSVALHENDTLLGSQDLLVDKSHSEFLAVMIQDLLGYTDKSMSDLTAVAVSKGPGSYTGLRIGVSTAKGICFGLNIPLISVNSLRAMAYEVNLHNIEGYDLCPMLDARRMEVYYLIADHELKVIQKTKAIVIDKNSFSKELRNKGMLFFGNGMSKCREMLVRNKNAWFIDNIHPRAANIGYLAFEKYNKKEIENTEAFEPFYLKDFIATTPKKMI